MFVQVITARVHDELRARDALDEWEHSVMPQADGYLGTTAGFTEDAMLVLIARFESEEAAIRNSERPEQASWWTELAACLDGDPYVIDSTDVRTWVGGGSDAADFVQVMIGHSPDVNALLKSVDVDARLVRRVRPEVLGGTLAAFGEDGYVQTIYFTCEDDARDGESRTRSEEITAAMDEHRRLLGDARFLDLHDPILVSAHS